MRWSRSDLIGNAERFAQINLDLSDFEKERNPSKTINSKYPQHDEGKIVSLHQFLQTV